MLTFGGGGVDESGGIMPIASNATAKHHPAAVSKAIPWFKQEQPAKEQVVTKLRALASSAFDITPRNKAVADAQQPQGSGFGGGFSTNRYAPNTEPLDRTSLLDDITPKSDFALMTLFETIYNQDAVAGPACRLISDLPWSDWSLSGIDDPGIMRVYEDAMETFDPITLMPELTREYLLYGRFVSSLIYDASHATWTNIINHNPKYVTITPVPVRGFDALIDLQPSPEMNVFLTSKDKRFQRAKSVIPDDIRKGLLKGKAELNPLTTLFVPRRETSTDWRGTSMFMRILPYYAIEKALIQSTISAARRRTRSILHLSVGIEGTWEPENYEIDSLATQFQASEEDPVGAIIATRTGVEANEIRSGSDFWKISEESDYLKTSKLNAFGLSESFLTGEASYNTMDAAMSVFIEGIKALRTTLDKSVFEDKVFDVLARANGFVKTKKADASHRVRTGRMSLAGLEDSLDIPKRDLLIPKIHWTKNLSPTSDANYIELLKSIKEQGIPIPTKMWASAVGIDLDDLEQALEEDQAIRDRFKKYVPAAPAQEEDGGFGAFSRFVDTDAVTVLGSFTDHEDHRHGNFFGVPYRELRAIALDLLSNNKRMRILRDNAALSSYLSNRFDGNQTKIDASKYMLTRMNLARAKVSDDFVTALATKLTVTCSKTKDKKALKALRTEVEVLSAVRELSRPARITKKVDKNAVASALRDAIKGYKFPQTGTALSANYAGV